ncbi:bola protein [Limtongia smithiae]|uniref:bola protein n=1 Tax=Limtongia smithiae TaxID=1125753 RepID=UPI0034CE3035
MVLRALPARLLSRPSSSFLRNMSISSSSSFSAAPVVEPDYSASTTPHEDRIRWVLTQAYSPTYLQIHNDSHKHAHHAPMRTGGGSETHFRIEVVSDGFAGKGLAARHREVYGMFKEEMSAPGGIHAMQLLTLTPEEYERRRSRA